MTAFNSKVGRLPADHGRPRADAHARDPRRARGEDPRVRAAQLLGSASARSAPRPANTPAAGSTRNSRSTDDDPGPARRAAVGRGARARDRRALRRQAGHRHRGIEAVDAERRRCCTTSRACSATRTAASASPRAPRCRSRRRCTKSTRSSPIRGPIRARCPRTTSARSRPRSRSWRESNAYGRFARKILKQKWVRPNKRIFDNSKISDHFAIIPTLVHAEEPERGRGEAVRPRRQALPRGVLSGRGVPGHHAHHARRGRAVQDRGQGARVSRAGSRCTARKRRRGRGPVARAGQARARRSTPRRSTSSRSSPVRRRASTKRRCCRRWKARAS